MPDRQILLSTSKFQVARQSVALNDGTTSSRELVVHPGAVVIVPWVDADRLCLIRNYRWAIDRTLLELPAGTLSPGEDPEQTALRELAEETGYRAGRLEKLLEFYPSPGIMTEVMHLYSAEQLTPGDKELELDERIEPVVVTWDAALKMVDSGEIVDAKTLVGLWVVERRRRRTPA
jgi:ADP-ribose pyrophosphatase